MSIKKSNKILPQTDASKFIVTGIILVVLVIIVIGLSSYYVGKKEGSTVDSPIPVIDLSQDTQLKILGDKIYNWTGKITRIDKQSIEFTTQIKDTSGELVTKDIIAMINSETVLKKWNLAQPANPGQPDSNKEGATLDQFKAGQQIIVKAFDNFNDKNEVTADSISLLLAPTASNW